MIWGQVRSESWLRRPNRRNVLSDCSCQSSAVLEGESLQETNKNSKATSCRLIGQTTATSGGWRWCENLCQRWHHEGSLHQWGGHQPHVIIDKSLIQGWGNIWDSAEHWPWMEGPTIAGELLKILLNITGNRVSCDYKFNSQFYNLRPLTDSNTLLEEEKNKIWIPSLTFVNTATQVSYDNFLSLLIRFTFKQFCVTFIIVKCLLIILCHFCQHCHSGFLWDFLLLSIRFAYNFMSLLSTLPLRFHISLLCFLWMCYDFLIQERSLRDNSSLVTVARNYEHHQRGFQNYDYCWHQIIFKPLLSEKEGWWGAVRSRSSPHICFPSYILT